MGVLWVSYGCLMGVLDVCLMGGLQVCVCVCACDRCAVGLRRGRAEESARDVLDKDWETRHLVCVAMCSILGPPICSSPRGLGGKK